MTQQSLARQPVLSSWTSSRAAIRTTWGRTQTQKKVLITVKNAGGAIKNLEFTVIYIYILGFTQKLMGLPRKSWFNQRKWNLSYKYQIEGFSWIQQVSWITRMIDGLKSRRYQHLDCCMNQMNWEFLVIMAKIGPKISPLAPARFWCQPNRRWLSPADPVQSPSDAHQVRWSFTNHWPFEGIENELKMVIQSGS